MNKLKITKGRLRQILAEEVARHQKQKLNEMTMAERGTVDAEDGNPPTKVGQGNEEYMKAYNAVMKKMGKDPLPMKQPDQAYLDALRSGRLEEMGAAEEEAEAASFAAQAKGAAATKAGAEGADAFYEGEEPMEEEKTEKYDDEMKEKFSKKQAEKLPDPLQKAMLKKEVRAMLEELMSDV